MGHDKYKESEDYEIVFEDGALTNLKLVELNNDEMVWANDRGVRVAFLIPKTLGGKQSCKVE